MESLKMWEPGSTDQLTLSLGSRHHCELNRKEAESMSEESGHLVRSPDGVEGVIVPYYLCLEQPVRPGPARGRTWRLRDEAAGGRITTVRSTLPQEDRICVRVEAPDQQPMEHILSRVYDNTGLHLSILSSVLSGNTVSWVNGLRIPTAWFLGHKEEAVSKEPIPGIKDKVAVSARLSAFKGNNFSLLKYSPLPKKEVAPNRFILDNSDEKDVIEIHQKVWLVSSSLELVNLWMYFYHGHGLVRAHGTVIEPKVNLHLAEIIDQ